MSSSFNSSNRWLSSSLPRHSIWELPPSSSAVSELARPASPDVSAILPQSTSSSLFSASKSKSSPFKSTSSRSDKSHSKSTSTKRDSGNQALDPSIPARKSRLAVARGSDLILAVGSELRIASLTDVKARCQQRDTADGLDDDDIELGDYKVGKGRRLIYKIFCFFQELDSRCSCVQTLNVPSVTFEIQQLVLNPSAKLLAVVGVRSVAVVVLPRKGWSTAVGHTLDCRSVQATQMLSLVLLLIQPIPRQITPRWSLLPFATWVTFSSPSSVASLGSCRFLTPGPHFRRYHPRIYDQ